MTTDLGYKIFLDRYALKKPADAELDVGDLVLVKVDGQKEIGHIVGLGVDPIIIATESSGGFTGRITIEFEDGTKVHAMRDEVDAPAEKHYEQMWVRVAKAVGQDEDDDIVDDFYELLKDWKFVPGGRILAGAGTDNLSYYNCFVIPSPKDSKDGIFDTLNTMSQIMSRGGGVGINISSLRPRYAPTLSTNGRSSGAVSWGEIYSFVTGLIEQGGSRRGALMLILEDWHPDLLEFIEVKQDMQRITNANISIGISDEFMEAVEADADWTFKFPDTKVPVYDTKWNGDLKTWAIETDNAVIEYKTMKARDVWQLIIESAWKCAEPGLWFKDRANQVSNSWYYAPLISTNPCGEQPLPAWGVCNLGALNLSKFVTNDKIGEASIDFGALKKAVRTAVRFLDNVIDITYYPYPEQEKQQKSERRIGLGTMGLAEMLIRIGVPYGSDDCLNILDTLYQIIAHEAYDASVELAMEKGAFELFKERYNDGLFMLNLARPLRDKIRKFGIRNVTLLTQAPTGSTGTMVNTSTGIEPYYAWEWTRKSRLGDFDEKAAVWEEWWSYAEHKSAYFINQAFFVTAQDLTPEQHIRVQAAIQKWTDSSISKTCNVPAHYTVEQVGELYKLMHKLGCKGGTVYRDTSRDVQVLSQVDNTGKVRHRPEVLFGKTYRSNTPAGTAYITINDRQEDGPFEVFINVGKAGSELAAISEALGRLISYVLRQPSAKKPYERVDDIIGQLRHIGSDRAFGFGKDRVGSLPDAIAQTLAKHVLADYEGDFEGLPEGDVDNGNAVVLYDLCPQCGDASFTRIEGCKKCISCGHSEC